MSDRTNKYLKTPFFIKTAFIQNVEKGKYFLVVETQDLEHIETPIRSIVLPKVERHDPIVDYGQMGQAYQQQGPEKGRCGEISIKFIEPLDKKFLKVFRSKSDFNCHIKVKGESKKVIVFKYCQLKLQEKEKEGKLNYKWFEREN